MPIPDLTDDGFLPPGVHDCTLEEIGERFGGFQRSGHRPRLFEELERFLGEAQKTGLLVTMIIDGSFVTDVAEPHDIDLILVLRKDHDFSSPLKPFEYNVVSRRQVHKLFGFDILVSAEGQLQLAEYIAFFSQVRSMPDRTKGMLRVQV